MSQADRDYELDKVLATYRLDGSMIRGKARALVEDWLDRLYPRMQDPDTPTSTFLDIGKTLMDLGDLRPKVGAAQGGTGAGFSISINIPSPNGGESITITGRSDGGENPPEILDITEFNPLPPRPSHIPVPDFNQNMALSQGFQSLNGAPSALGGGINTSPVPTQGGLGVSASLASTPNASTQQVSPAMAGDGVLQSRPFSVPVEITPAKLANPAQPA